MPESSELDENIKSKGNLIKALDIAGDSHRYQKVIVACMAVTWTVANMCLVGTSFILNNPLFFCESAGGVLVSEKQACEMMKVHPAKCRVSDSFTLTAQMGLFCEREQQRTLIQALYAIGSIVALPVLNFISDIIGRKITFLTSGLSIAGGCVAVFFGGLGNIIGLLYVGIILIGIGTFGFESVTLVIATDFCGDLLRQKAFTIFNMAYFSGLFLLAGFYIIEMDWKVFLFGFIFSPILVITTFMWFYMVESPYVLMGQNLKEECLDSFLEIADKNERDSPQNIGRIQKIVEEQPLKAKEEQSSVQTLLIVLKQKRYLITILILALCQAMRDTNSIGMNYVAKEIGFGYATNFIITGVIQILSIAVLYRYIDRLGRKKSIFCLVVVCLLLQSIFFWDGLNQAPMLETALMMLVRMFLGVEVVLLACLEVECFPVQIQSAAIGVIRFLCLVGFLIAPLVVELAHRLEVSGMGLLGLSSLLTALSILFIEEKSHHRKTQ